MRILLITQYFHPEPGAPTNRLISFAREFAHKGHKVTVLCEFPNYPSGVLEKKDRFKIFRKETFENFKIVRTCIIPTRRSNTISRLINYCSFLVSSLLVGLFLERPDLILVSSPPLFAGPAAVWLSILKRVPLVSDIRDLWPEDAILMGQLSNRLAIWGGRKTADLLYRNSSIIITISEGLKDKLNKMVSGKDIFVIVNGSSAPDFWPDLKTQQHAPDSPFTVCYAGALGLGQPIEDIIDAAESTKSDKSTRYLIVGDGVRRDSLITLVNSKRLENVIFTGGVSYAKSLELLSESDVAVVSLVNTEIFKSAIPSKFFDCMALGLPIILGVDGEIRAILEENETGLYYRSGDWRDLRDKILYLKRNPEIARRFGENGRKLVWGRYRRSDLAARLESLLTNRFSKGY